MGRASFRLLEDGEIELDVDYGVRRDAGSWLEELDDPGLVVTGASGFIGRYVVDLLVTLGYRVFASDVGERPRYLSRPKFAAVDYARADLREEGELAALMERARPAAVFHIGAIFDFSAPADLLREVNVAGTERVCEAAREAGARRFVYWSTGSVYAPSDAPAAEDAPKAPADPYAASKHEGELAAFAYHDPPRFEVFSVRPAMVSGILSRYGSGLVARLIHEGYLVGPPQRRGLTTAVVNARDVASLGYLLAARRLGIKAASADDVAFNATADPIAIDEMMRSLAAIVPRRHILGVRTRLAEILGFGYQERIRLPARMLAVVGQASALVTRALNQVRPVGLQPKIPPETIPYLTGPHPMSNEKAQRLLGWSPDPVDADLAETLRYYEETGWAGFDRRAPSGSDGNLELMDEAKRLISEFETEPEDEEARMVAVPSLGLEVDHWSLRILVRAAEAHLLARAYEGGTSDLAGASLPGLAAHALEDVALHLKHEYAGSFGAGGVPEAAVPALVRRLVSLDRNAVVSWILAANAARFLGGVREAGETLRRCSLLLPDGRHGLLIETGCGDIAVELRKQDGELAVSFPRAEVDSVPSHLPLQAKLDRLRKLCGMGLCLGARFADLAELLSGRADFDRATRLVTASPHRVFIKLSKRMERAGWAALLFEDDEGRLVLGLDVAGRVGFLSPERLGAVETARNALGDGFGEAAGERVKFYPVGEFRRLLSEAIYSGIISRLLGR